METDNRKSFTKGLALGIAVSLTVAIISIFIAITGMDIKSGRYEADPTPTQSASNPTSKTPDIFESVTNEQLLAKIKEIKAVIDQGSLYGASDEDQANAVIAGILNALNDNYAAYYTVDNMTAFQESTSGTYSGIGALVSQDPNTKSITIVRPFEGGPAYNAGMLKGDIIIKVDDLDVTAMDINEVVTYMKGKAGTKVNITVLRNDEELTFELIRATIEVPTVEYEMLENDIGYIQVTEFDGVTVEQFMTAITKLESQGMKALVLDLRDNPGGLVSTAVSLVDRIVPTGVVVYTEDKNGNREYEYATTATEVNIPIAVLVNGNSASASEIFAGALRDYDKATIVGTTSYGKGIVQVIQYLSDYSGLKYTISQYFTPSGYAVHGVGIVPDIEVELDEELLTLSEIPKDKDNQLQTAIDELMKQLSK